MIGCMTESSVGISAGIAVASLCDFADLDGANLISNDFAKDHENLVIKAGIVDGKVIGVEEVKALASLPSKDSALTAEKDNAANNIKVNKNILLNFIISQKNIIISFNNVI